MENDFLVNKNRNMNKKKNPGSLFHLQFVSFCNFFDSKNKQTSNTETTEDASPYNISYSFGSNNSDLRSRGLPFFWNNF
jgi:hypothetical protein